MFKLAQHDVGAGSILLYEINSIQFPTVNDPNNMPVVIRINESEIELMVLDGPSLRLQPIPFIPSIEALTLSYLHISIIHITRIPSQLGLYECCGVIMGMN